MWKRILGLSLIVIGSLGLLKAVTERGKHSVQFEEGAHNLALRQVAHNLYLLQSDSTSRIAPVENINDSTYQVRIDKRLNYEELPHLIKKAVDDYNLNSDYIVTIKDCVDDKIVLGFNSVPLGSTEQTCSSREHELDCSFLGVTFLAKPVKLNSNIPLFLGFLLIGSLVFLFNNRKKVLNQTSSSSENQLQSQKESIALGNFNFDPTNQTISMRTESVSLTFRENKLLKYMCENINIVIKRDDIMANVWEEEGIIVGRSLDVFISRLRKILKDDPSIQIKSVHGVGYRLVVNQEMVS
ncbi:winged helix-turn-helix domain-containing protein [bacterium]|nr:winged helix-turn-helix domain-containing protein [bacterium]